MDATDILRREHDAVLIALDILEALARDAGTDEFAKEHANSLLEFFKTFVDQCHHTKEERYLFPALEEAGVPVEGGPIGVMLAEHDEGRAYVVRLRDTLARLTDTADDADAAGEFRSAAVGFAALLRAHIDKENEILFVMAAQVLSPEIHEQLVKDFEAVENDHIGAGVHERFHRMLDELKARYLDSAVSSPS